MTTFTRPTKSNARKLAAASAERMAAERAKVIAAVKANTCPVCGRPLRRNSSIAGWWQCSQFGAVGFRADSNAPACDWQGVH